MTDQRPVPVADLRRVADVAFDAVVERMRAWTDEGYDLDYDLRHGGAAHAASWARSYVRRAFSDQIGHDRRRRLLVQAAGLLLAAVDALDHDDREDQAGSERVVTPILRVRRCGRGTRLRLDRPDTVGVSFREWPDTERGNRRAERWLQFWGDEFLDLRDQGPLTRYEAAKIAAERKWAQP